MIIKIKNRDLKGITDFLLKLSLKGKKSTNRMRLVKALQVRNEALLEEETELLKQYVELDEHGEFVRNSDGGFQLKGDSKEFKKLQTELMDEDYIVNDVNLDSSLKAIEEIISDYNKELSHREAEAHFSLVEAFEEKDERGENKDVE
ncbi:hypothetical protein BpsS140_00033 [Bacillus phage vB_BpsS-140]|nr:hypothetical protein BpsS140_00033 [Bacillus phage vB_BpsS-140]